MSRAVFPRTKRPSRPGNIVKKPVKRKITTTESNSNAKDAEREVHAALEALRSLDFLVFERIPDFASARVYVGRRSDFDFCAKGGVYGILEVKASLVKATITGIAIPKIYQPAQIAGAYQYGRMGAIAMTLFRGTEGWLYYDTFAVVQPDPTGRIIPTGVAVKNLPGFIREVVKSHKPIGLT